MQTEEKLQDFQYRAESWRQYIDPDTISGSFRLPTAEQLRREVRNRREEISISLATKILPVLETLVAYFEGCEIIPESMWGYDQFCTEDELGHVETLSIPQAQAFLGWTMPQKYPALMRIAINRRQTWEVLSQVLEGLDRKETPGTTATEKAVSALIFFCKAVSDRQDFMEGLAQLFRSAVMAAREEDGEGPEGVMPGSEEEPPMIPPEDGSVFDEEEYNDPSQDDRDTQSAQNTRTSLDQALGRVKKIRATLTTASLMRSNRFRGFNSLVSDAKELTRKTSDDRDSIEVSENLPDLSKVMSGDIFSFALGLMNSSTLSFMDTLTQLERAKVGREVKFIPDPSGPIRRIRRMANISEIASVSPSKLATARSVSRLYMVSKMVTNGFYVQEKGRNDDYLQMAVVLVDTSGSMTYGSRIQRMLACVLNRLHSVCSGDSEMLLIPYDSEVRESYEIRTRDDALKAIRALSQLNYAGGTATDVAIAQAVKLTEAYMAKHSLVDRPDVLVVTDEDGSAERYDPSRLIQLGGKIHAVSLANNPGLDKLVHATKGQLWHFHRER